MIKHLLQLKHHFMALAFPYSNTLLKKMQMNKFLSLKKAIEMLHLNIIFPNFILTFFQSKKINQNTQKRQHHFFIPMKTNQKNH